MHAKVKLFVGTIISFLVISYAPISLSTDLTISQLYNNLFTNVLKQIIYFVADIGVVVGAFLVVMGIVTLYNSHVKQASGGKSMHIGLVALFAGSMLMGLPVCFNLMSNSVVDGMHTVGDTAGIVGASSIIRKPGS